MDRSGKLVTIWSCFRREGLLVGVLGPGSWVLGPGSRVQGGGLPAPPFASLAPCDREALLSGVICWELTGKQRSAVTLTVLTKGSYFCAFSGHWATVLARLCQRTWRLHGHHEEHRLMTWVGGEMPLPRRVAVGLSQDCGCNETQVGSGLG